MSDAAEELTEIEDDADDCEHNWISEPAAEVKYLRGNAEIKRVARWMLYCSECGRMMFADDPSIEVPKA